MTRSRFGFRFPYASPTVNFIAIDGLSLILSDLGQLFYSCVVVFPRSSMIPFLVWVTWPGAVIRSLVPESAGGQGEELYVGLQPFSEHESNGRESLDEGVGGALRLRFSQSLASPAAAVEPGDACVRPPCWSCWAWKWSAGRRSPSPASDRLFFDQLALGLERARTWVRAGRRHGERPGPDRRCRREQFPEKGLEQMSNKVTSSARPPSRS